MKQLHQLPTTEKQAKQEKRRTTTQIIDDAEHHTNGQQSKPVLSCIDGNATTIADVLHGLQGTYEMMLHLLVNIDGIPPDIIDDAMCVVLQRIHVDLLNGGQKRLFLWLKVFCHDEHQPEKEKMISVFNQETRLYLQKMDEAIAEFINHSLEKTSTGLYSAHTVPPIYQFLLDQCGSSAQDTTRTQRVIQEKTTIKYNQS